MDKGLLSVGLDVGTTTTQLIVSRLQVENRAGAFSVPEMAITDRQILYRSPVRFTPLIRDALVDGEALARWVTEQYRLAGVDKAQVDTGAVIITGETSRKENAATVLAALSGFAGDFVAAVAGPHLESVLAAKGAGALALCAQQEGVLLHMDIGGGTTNLALLEGGKLLRTGCLNVGGRLIRQEQGRVTYVSSAIAELCSLKHGDQADCQSFARLLAEGLEMAAGLRPATSLLEKLSTREAGPVWEPPEKVAAISFSGGVADCITGDAAPGQYGDMGVELGKAIRESRLCAGTYYLGKETIRATVVGAGCHSARLSGSTVYYRGAALPKKNLPVVVFTAAQQEDPQLPARIAQRLQTFVGEPVLLAFPGYADGSYRKISALAEAIGQGVTGEVLVCLEADMAKALGQRLALLYPGRPLLCIDRLRLPSESYLDIGNPVGPALPVVIKTLVLG